MKPGDRIQSYVVIGEAGRGGMGIVYHARDESLDRDVAIKVLPEIVAFNPERMARFEREAKLLASLSHPNIALIYGLEQVEGAAFRASFEEGGFQFGERVVRSSLFQVVAVEFSSHTACVVPEERDAGVDQERPLFSACRIDGMRHGLVASHPVRAIYREHLDPWKCLGEGRRVAEAHL